MWQWILRNLIRSEETNRIYDQIKDKSLVRYFR